jgi:hypothetical protein
MLACVLLYGILYHVLSTVHDGDETPHHCGGLDRSFALCDTPIIPQGLRKFTLVEVASGHDMTM